MSGNSYCINAIGIYESHNCFFVIEHGRRRILHFNVTSQLSSEWVVQQLREAFPDAGQYRYVIMDHDSKFNGDVIAFLEATGLMPKHTSIQAPWQNGTAERWVGSCRRELLDHVIPVNEPHLLRLIGEYVNYHHQDRIHDALDKDTPTTRVVESRPAANATVISSAASAVCITGILGQQLRSNFSLQIWLPGFGICCRVRGWPPPP
jgi:hypothetical protein